MPSELASAQIAAVPTLLTKNSGPMASAPTRIPSLPGTADDIPASENSWTLTPDAASRVASPIPSRLGLDSAQHTVRPALRATERSVDSTARLLEHVINRTVRRPGDVSEPSSNTCDASRAMADGARRTCS